MNYKEIKKHNRAEYKKYFDTWLTDNPYKANYINLYEYIIEKATTDEGMTISDKVQFHYFNPNGACAKLPELEDFECIDDPSKYNLTCMIYSRHESYGAKQLSKMLRKKRVKKWEVDYAVSKIYKDIEEAKKVMIEKNLVGKNTYAKREVA